MGSSEECPCRRSLLRKSIFTAAQDGDLKHVQAFFECSKAHLHVDFTDDFGYTSLHYAAQWNRTLVVEYLLKKGATVDSRVCGATALHRAAFRGSKACVELLVAYGADVNLPDESFGDQKTALHKAASQGHEEIVQLMIKAGADMTLKDAFGLGYDECIPQTIDDRSKRNICQEDDAIVLKEDATLGVRCSRCQQVCIVIVRNHCCRLVECEACYDKGLPCPICGTVSIPATSIDVEPAIPIQTTMPTHTKVTNRSSTKPIVGLLNIKKRKETIKST
ncbi:hypothetical protein THRCLA_04459 [Thraustotheca clavata]|uniref:Uncharacterized protein n=1 Tax=Thraustotheca clavata TaxID=74557 RepID=A0A1V9ZZ72_9STRA|nr:hypothetical protein THRCLA_04459 [Thraustotheca clavata]